MIFSLPLDRARRLACYVVDDAVDALDLVDDASRRAAEEGHVEGIEIGCHAIDRGHRAQRADGIKVRPSPITPTVRTGNSTANACQIRS